MGGGSWTPIYRGGRHHDIMDINISRQSGRNFEGERGRRGREYMAIKRHWFWEGGGRGGREGHHGQEYIAMNGRVWDTAKARDNALSPLDPHIRFSGQTTRAWRRDYTSSV